MARAHGTRERGAHPTEEEAGHVMLPMVGVPDTIRKGLRPYGDLFRRAEGFAHVSRYGSGLRVSPNKTWQGIYATQVWEEDTPSRRTRHEAGFAAGWKAEE